MNGMILHVAKAIAASQEQYPRNWDQLLPLEKNIALLAAKAAIDAMREPTEAMLKASNIQWPEIAKYQYQRMIEGDLKDA